MASNFPMTVDDKGNLVQIISGRSKDASQHFVKFSSGAEQLIQFLDKVAPGLIER